MHDDVLYFTLKFLTPVHFGDTANGGSLDKFSLQCRADTLFAALCNEAANKGSDAVATLVKKTAEGKIVFSSLFPYWRTADDDLYFYLPKPLLKLEQDEQQSAKSFEEIKQLATKLKKQKNQHIYVLRRLIACWSQEAVIDNLLCLSLLLRLLPEELHCVRKNRFHIMWAAMYSVSTPVCISYLVLSMKKSLL